MDELAALRADLEAKQRAYYRALDSYREAVTDAWSRAGADRAKMRDEMLRAHRAYTEARERLFDELGRRRSSGTR